MLGLSLFLTKIFAKELKMIYFEMTYIQNYFTFHKLNYYQHLFFNQCDLSTSSDNDSMQKLNDRQLFCLIVLAPTRFRFYRCLHPVF